MTRLETLQGKLYRVIAEYRDPKQAAFTGQWQGFTQAADLAADMASRERNTLRLVVIINYSGVVVAAHSLAL